MPSFKLTTGRPECHLLNFNAIMRVGLFSLPISTVGLCFFLLFFVHLSFYLQTLLCPVQFAWIHCCIAFKAKLLLPSHLQPLTLVLQHQIWNKRLIHQLSFPLSHRASEHRTRWLVWFTPHQRQSSCDANHRCCLNSDIPTLRQDPRHPREQACGCLLGFL